MNWSYVAGFFDGEGNVHINKISKKQGEILSYQAILRFYNSDLTVLEKIKDFLKCGHIYTSKKNKPNWSPVHELTIIPKENVKEILIKLSENCICKKNKIDYLLKNFNFDYNNNSSFNLEEFHSLTSRKNTDIFYTKKELNIFSTRPCPICGNHFIYSVKRTACSDTCRSKLKASKIGIPKTSV